MGLNTCADCDISLIEELPPGQEYEPARLHPILEQIIRSLAFVRNNEKASWTFAVIAGIFFYLAYGYSKNLWREDTRFIEYVASLIDPSSKRNVFLITISINILVDVISAFVASLLCGVLFVYVLQKERITYCFGAVASFFLLYIRGWHFWKAPDLGMLISSFIAPFLIAVVFIKVKQYRPDPKIFLTPKCSGI